MKTKIFIKINGPLTLAFDTLEREQAFVTVLHGAIKNAGPVGNMFLPNINVNEYPDTDGEKNA